MGMTALSRIDVGAVLRESLSGEGLATEDSPTSGALAPSRKTAPANPTAITRVAAVAST